MRYLTLIIGFVVLAGCGQNPGDGGSADPPATATNSPPTIDGPSNFEVTSGDLFAPAFTFSDTDSSNLSFSISGTDASLFRVSSSGEVRFINTPSFDSPQDANGDNQYQITLNVSDGTNTTSQPLTIDIKAALFGRVLVLPVEDATVSVFEDVMDVTPMDQTESDADGRFKLRRPERQAGKRPWVKAEGGQYSGVNETNQMLMAADLPLKEDEQVTISALSTLLFASPDFETTRQLQLDKAAEDDGDSKDEVDIFELAANGDAEATSFIRNNAEAWTVIEAAARLSEGLETTDAVTHKLNLARGLAKTSSAADPLTQRKKTI